MGIPEFLQTTIQRLEAENIVFLRVKISPNANENKITEIMEDEEKTVKVSIKAQPEKGKANKEIVKFLGKQFACECEIISGNTGSVKLVKLKK
jgi:uncharacterized protein